MRAWFLVVLAACGSDPAHPLDAAIDARPDAPADVAPDAAVASIESFAAAHAVVTAGDPTQLVAVFDGAGTIDHGVGAVESGTPVATNAVAATTTFTLTVTDTLGGTATAETTVTAVNPPAITLFAPTSPIVSIGNAAELNAAFVGIGTVEGVGHISSGVPLTTGAITAATTTFTLSVENAVGVTTTAQTTVTGVPLPAITSFTADATSIPAGTSTTLHPVFTDGTGVIGVVGVLDTLGAVASGDAIDTGPVNANTVFVLTVTNAAGDLVQAGVEVDVTPTLRRRK